MQAYQELKAYFKRISDFEHIQAMLQWDEASMMPAGGGDARAEATSTLASTIHELKTSTQLGDLIAKVDTGSLASVDLANLNQMKRAFDLARALPNDFVGRRSLAISKSEQAWRILRGKNDWQTFRPLLEKTFAFAKEEASYYAAQSGLSPYDAMLDLYEPDMNVARIEPLFADLREFIPSFLKQVMAAQKPPTLLPKSFPIAKQRELGLKLMKSLGFDFNHGRLDTSHHPFCGGVADDVRITTRYSEDSFFSALMGVLHETGHAMYEQGLPKEWRGQPVGVALGMMIHESQSLFWEMQVCRSRSYYKYSGPIIREAFDVHDQKAEAWTDENLWRLGIGVKPGLIRVDADEVCYPLHIVMRFEIEKALFSGEITIKDLPEIWNQKMKHYFGLETEGNYKDGVMQDVHWPAGIFGYFPCYSLGAITAAQLFESARKSIPNIDAEIAAGNFSAILNWLRTNVHSQGRIVSAEKLISNATGQPLTSKAFIAHLKNRYLS